MTDDTAGEPITEADEERPVYRQSRFQPLPGACEILLVRHGESAPYVDGIAHPLVDGQGDPPLDPHGHAQAERVAERLIATGEPISAIYVTTMQRTRQTAAPFAERIGLEPTVIADLREVHLGDWEGGEFRKKMAEGDPRALQVATEERWDVIPGGETTEAFATRVRRGIERIAAAHPDQVVAAFVHGGVIGQAVSLATGARGFSFVGADNASITHLVVMPDRWIVRCFNDTSHLSPTFSSAAEPLT